VANKPLLSMVITSYTTERLKDIFELLDRIKAQTYSDFEIIFIAERSKELEERVKNYVGEKNIPNMKVIFNNGEQGMSSARNLGIQQAKGDIIAFIDDDALPFPDWAEEMVKTYEDGSVIGVTGPVSPLWEDEAVDWFPDELDWILGCSSFSGITQNQEIRNVWGTNMSFRREAFNVAGTFSSTIGAIQGKRLHGEEVELSLRIKERTKKQIIYNPKVRVKHKVYKNRLSSRFIARSSYWIGYTRYGLKKLYPNGYEGNSLLNVEHQLLRRIFIRLFPSILKTFLIKPVIACHKLRVTTIALSSVAFGYFSYLFLSLIN